MGFGVWCLGFGRFGVQGLGFRFWGLVFRVWAVGAWGLGFRKFRVWGLGFGV